eukprot:TRINITY_DN7473_c0_g2_i1.p1 TRINITY_DN7473_c0_g2~~TRINITY_DN7473_c0_g2_i1.p1  ORF type:complete len:237 (+),score=56.23 TRINITY_DN7473_c0_g2_i1:288-998(+)
MGQEQGILRAFDPCSSAAGLDSRADLDVRRQYTGHGFSELPPEEAGCQKESPRPVPRGPPFAACNALLKCGAVGGDETGLMDHELLSCARRGDAAGVQAALRKGAWTEARRPLVVKPYPQDRRSNDHDVKFDGMTSLMYAAQLGSADVVALLLQARAEANAMEEDDWMPLHFAAREAHLPVCRQLLDARADSELATSDGQTPLDLAYEAEDPAFARRFLEVITAAEGRVKLVDSGT